VRTVFVFDDLSIVGRQLTLLSDMDVPFLYRWRSEFGSIGQFMFQRKSDRRLELPMRYSPEYQWTIEQDFKRALCYHRDSPAPMLGEGPIIDEARKDYRTVSLFGDPELYRSLRKLLGKKQESNQCFYTIPPWKGINGENIPAEMCEAAAHCNPSELQELLDRGFDIDEIDLKTGDTPLLVALKTAKLEVAEFLIKKGANVNLCNDEGKTPLHLAAFHLGEEHRIFRLLIESGADQTFRDRKGLFPTKVRPVLKKV
jgi:hypothetical protein